ncbi:MAG: hypothetical protein PVJ49_18430 [Acidobacteriota bacterium]|jgi:hypothetical protein
MSNTSIHLLRVAAFVLAVVMTLAGTLPAAAGCLSEYDQCGTCARRHLRDAVLDLDAGGIEDAFLEGLDCDIDFVHCLLFGHHHDYTCGL